MIEIPGWFKDRGCLSGHMAETTDNTCECCGADVEPHVFFSCDEYEPGSVGAVERDRAQRMNHLLGMFDRTDTPFLDMIRKRE